MADFRKWLFALAVVALLAGLTVPASAQQSTVICTVQSATDNLIRSQGYTEQVGDVVLACTGGVPTVAGGNVNGVNIQIFVSSVNITSQITQPVSGGGSFSEALLIIDEPNSPTNPNIPLLNCGSTTPVAAPEQPNNAGVCAITSTGVPSQTYNGTANHPNVFQGRQALGSLVNNSIVFQGVPFDPPGTLTRTLRFTNVRVNANQLGIQNPTAQVTVTMGITSSGSASLPINILSLPVATIQNGLTVSTIQTESFAQCIPNNAHVTGTFASNAPAFVNNSPFVRFAEGFSSSWKVRNISESVPTGTGSASGTGGNGVLSPSSPYGFIYDGSTIHNPTDLNQNVPGFNYFTETGFENNAAFGVPAAPVNPPYGGNAINGTPVIAAFQPFNSASTGISKAGMASQGTRLALTLSNLPLGVTLYVPPVLFLWRQGHTYTGGTPDVNDGSATGVAVLTSTDSFGDTAYNPPSGAASNALTAVSQSNGGALIVYEILFTDPFSNEYMDVPIVVSFSPNLSANPPLGLPQPNVQAAYTGGFAPFETVLTAVPLATDPIPRFFYQNQGGNIFSIARCSCNLLFPFVTQQFGYDTGIAIANTSSDPFGIAQPQSGTVTFNYYGITGTNNPPPTAQTTSASTPVLTGTVLVYTLSNGNPAVGLDNRGANFTGYLITQAQFQYCHGFAFISALNAGPTSPGISEGYLALVLDLGQLPRTGITGETLGQ